MLKRKAEFVGLGQAINGSKKIKQEAEKFEKSSLLDDSDSTSSDDSDGGAKLGDDFKINEEFAKRFEYNKKREEIHRLEEKYQKPTRPTNGQYGDKYDEDSESSNDEDEDDEGFLATEDLDAEISATLQAIRMKDPRVYDEKVTFYKPVNEDEETPATKTEKPMYLSDYHRFNLLKGNIGAEEEELTPRTFAQEQEDLKRTIVREMHAGAEESSDEDDGFLVPKSKPETPQIHPSRTKAALNLDVESADKDPETFLSNFMAARAWVPSDGARFQPLESDDEEEDERAEKFEVAYNLRFEDPAGSNEMLKSYAREIASAKSVRRDEPNSRKKQRDSIREKREAEKREKDEERARLRKLKIEEMEEKLKIIKKAAGLKGKPVQNDNWMKFLDDNYDDDSWEAEMNKRFGEEYYAEQEVESAEEGGKKKVKKPKWDDDIDINDLVPDFDDQEIEKPIFTLSDSDDDEESSPKSKSSKDRLQEKQSRRKAARLERAKIEDLVDNHLDLVIPSSSKQPARFRYRETSPVSFGLTARDILMAPDTSLNQFAGLKKMAAFRDAEKKRKDKKNLGKKARLRQWRKETFGNEEGPEIVIGNSSVDAGNVDVAVPEKKTKKRSRKNKGKSVVES